MKNKIEVPSVVVAIANGRSSIGTKRNIKHFLNMIAFEKLPLHKTQLFMGPTVANMASSAIEMQIRKL